VWPEVEKRRSLSDTQLAGAAAVCNNAMKAIPTTKATGATAARKCWPSSFSERRKLLQLREGEACLLFFETESCLSGWLYRRSNGVRCSC